MSKPIALLVLPLAVSLGACAHGTVPPVLPAAPGSVVVGAGGSAAFDLSRADHLSFRPGLDVSATVAPNIDVGARAQYGLRMDRSLASGFARYRSANARRARWAEVEGTFGAVRHHLSVPDEWSGDGGDFFVAGHGLRLEVGYARDRHFLAPRIHFIQTDDPRSIDGSVTMTSVRFGAILGDAGQVIPEGEIRLDGDHPEVLLRMRFRFRTFLR